MMQAAQGQLVPKALGFGVDLEPSPRRTSPTVTTCASAGNSPLPIAPKA
jgi:hypothetical protein